MATSASHSLGPDEREAREITVGARAVLFLAGVVGLGVGIFVIADPNRTLTIVGIVLGIYLLVWGLVKLYRSGDEETRTSRAVSIFIGLVGVAAGIVVLVRPTGSLRVIAWAFGIYLIVLGVVSLAQVAAAKVRGEGIRAIASLIDIAAGIVVVAWPSLGLYTLALILGVYLIVRGALNITISLAPGREMAKAA